MGLQLPGKWVWDFWPVHDGSQHHLFYLQAPRAIGHPGLRHHHASVGHAVSADLRSWRVLPDALHPGPPGSWDDLATWTGSAIGHAGRWFMLYTGISRAEGGLVQRIGLAESDDLIHWHKHPANPVLEADGRWYELLDSRRWRDQSWRDPWLLRDPGGAMFHVLITARSPAGPAAAAGVVGHARSPDLVSWEILPPLTEPGLFAQAEVPQVVRLNGQYQLLVSCLAEDHAPASLARLGGPGQSGTFAFTAPHPLGPFTYNGGPLAAPDGPLGPLYAGKLIEAELGAWCFMAFRGDTDDSFRGDLTDPIPVRCGPGGRLIVNQQPPRQADGKDQDSPAHRTADHRAEARDEE